MTKNPESTQSAMLKRRENAVAAGVMSAHPVVIARAEGAQVWDVDGREYIDFVGGIGVLNVGHNHPKVIAAATAQMQQLSHNCFQVAAYAPYIELAERLNAAVGTDASQYRTVLLTTGAEAVENAVKIARGATNRPGVIAFRGGFHGRTLLGMTLTGMSQPYKQNFGPFAPDVYHCAYPDAYRGITSKRAIDSIEELFVISISPDRVAAILVEPVQGDGGFLQAPAEFMQAIRAICDKHGIVFIADEIQTGFGRTGKMFGFQHSGVQPDLVTIAKSLAGGFPVSAVTGKVGLMNALQPGGLGGTYGGNPVACAAALAVMKVFEDEHLLERSVQLGEQLEAGFDELFAKYSCIGQSRGAGPMRALEFVTSRETKEPDAAMAQRVLDQLRKQGVLAIKCGVYRNVVRCLVPLVASSALVDRAMKAFDLAIADAARQ
jgi:4-aminobutyrate aminotransferase/(S)-3-amino-2-methylpropionate transaminase